MSEHASDAETITVTNKLSTVPDSKAAIDLFARVLRAVREQTQEDEREKNSGKSAA